MYFSKLKNHKFVHFEHYIEKTEHLGQMQEKGPER